MSNEPLLDSLIESISSYIKNKADINLIEKAYFLAKNSHEKQIRKSGEPYITHPVAVAKILAELGVSPSTLIAGLLHDVVEDTAITLDDIEKEFDKDIRSMIDGVTKIGKISFNSEISQSDNHQKMLIAMAKDIRVIIIKIADRLHNMRTLDHLRQEKQYRISLETLEIYAPIAHRLGMFRIKAELEDRALRYTNPPMYYKISNLVKNKKEERESSIKNVIKGIGVLFDTSQLNDYEIKGRIKNVYSIYKKMANNDKDFEDIYDLLAIRIIVDKVENCYQALGIIHANFTPIPRRFKDYIAVPKPNMYQSLHTTVLSLDETLFEVQIRTHEMDKVAEYGIAAHWAYKENKNYSHEKEQFEIASKLKWYGDLLRMTEDDDEQKDGAKEFVDSVKGDILGANVYVFSPKGEVIELPLHSTPIDFAYKIHTDIGHKMVGAIVNSKIVPLDYEFSNGDIVSIKTNKSSTGPSVSWLKLAKSAHARHKIKGFLNKQNYDEFFTYGKETVEKELIAHKFENNLDDDFVKKHFEKNGITTLDELYFSVGKGILSSKTIIGKLVGSEVNHTALLQKQMEKASKQLISNSETGAIIEGLDNPQIKLANCCLPIPGDKIYGYVSKGSGIVVHAEFCPNAKTLDQNRLLTAYWANNITRKYPTWLKITATSRDTLVQEIITAINASGISIAEMNVLNRSTLETVIKIKVSVTNLSSLEILVVNLRKVNDVYDVERDIK